MIASYRYLYPLDYLIGLFKTVQWSFTSPDHGISGTRRIWLVRREPEIDERLGRLLHVELALTRELGKGGGDDRLSTHLEVVTKVQAILASTKSISSQRDQTIAQPRRKLIRHDLHEVGRGNDRPFRPGNCLQNVGHLLRLGRIEPVESIDPQRVTPQLIVTRHTPDIGVDLVLLGENLLRSQ